MSEKLLIVNADDYGLTTEVSRGIRHAHLEGIVTSTTAMMNMPGVAKDLQVLQHEAPSLGLGVHLTLTAGQPVLSPSEVPSLVSSEGCFHTLSEIKERAPDIDPNQVYEEWQAQILRLISLGFFPDHLDSHHHISYKQQDWLEVLVYLAQQFDLPARSASVYKPSLASSSLLFVQSSVQESRLFRSTDVLITKFYGTAVTHAVLSQLLQDLTDGVTELMVHPGYPSQELSQLSSYQSVREAELELLTDATIKKLVQDQAIRLATFATY